MKRQTIRCASAALLGLALAVLLVWLGATAPARAGPNTTCVNQSGTGCDAVCGGGCFASVQAAIDAALPGGEVRIAGGTYTDPGGTVAAITKSLILRGGYDPACAALNPTLYHTMLDGQWGGSVVSITNAGEVLLEHLTLTHGDGSGNCGSNYGCGGGVYATGTDLRMGDCVITNSKGSASGGARGGGFYAYAHGHTVEMWGSHVVSNTAAPASSASTEYGYGGGIYIEGGTVSLWENEILDNVGSVNHGGSGGIHLSDVASADVLTNTIRGNKANVSIYWSGGGGLYIIYSSAVYVAGNRIEGNWAASLAGYGGGAYVYKSDAHLARNLIVSNTTGTMNGYGGGVYVFSTTPVTLSNNLIVRNSAATSGGGVCVSRSAAPASRAILVNNTIADNGDTGVVASQYAVLTMTNNIVAGHTTGLTVGQILTGTIVADHNLFWNTSDPITGSNAIVGDPLLTADYHLRTGSPAADAGLTIPWLTTDLEGNSRPQGSAYDLGAYEGVTAAVFLPLVVRNR